MPKEVGKVGTNSPTYIEPVSERKDGIAAFFKHQENIKSPAKKSKKEVVPSAKASKDVKDEHVKEPKDDDVAQIEGLGDDSNAPQSQSSKMSGQTRKRANDSQTKAETRSHIKRPKTETQSAEESDVIVIEDDTESELDGKHGNKPTSAKKTKQDSQKQQDGVKPKQEVCGLVVHAPNRFPVD